MERRSPTASRFHDHRQGPAGDPAPRTRTAAKGREGPQTLENAYLVCNDEVSLILESMS